MAVPKKPAGDRHLKSPGLCYSFSTFYTLSYSDGSKGLTGMDLNSGNTGMCLPVHFTTLHLHGSFTVIELNL